ncbi:hypothetical protein HCC61_00250 [Streptomyces sp. HNM0575]|uniref:hypothetical protein n=1 Tax=Streptomyces sp. HNM0575 TaxID=2716338 RepID=UPI00145D688A|nr:hypothetical protein [Streptomyces sp. HNM0575]NLU71149.1 hypothetical protein [Streptomyces sp. HNM0575]
MQQNQFAIELRDIEQGPKRTWQTFVEIGSDRSRRPAAWIVAGDPSSPRSSAAAVGSAKPDGGSQVTSRDVAASVAARKAGGYAPGKQGKFALHAATQGQELLCVIRPDPSVEGDSRSYVVDDAQRQNLCRIRKGRSASGLRRAWHLEVSSSGEVFTGCRGTFLGWALFILFLPLWIPLTLISVVVGFMDSGTWDSLTWQPPRRTVWRRRGLGPKALEYKSSGSHWYAGELIDRRIAFAQTLLRKVG